MSWIDDVSFNSEGLIPVIAQDWQSNQVLMMAWMNKQALQETFNTKCVTYWSRSRQKLWRKGEQSGNTQELIELRLDCDGDTVLMKIKQRGGVACHTGRASCFYKQLDLDQDQPCWEDKEPVLIDPKAMYS